MSKLQKSFLLIFLVVILAFQVYTMIIYYEFNTKIKEQISTAKGIFENIAYKEESVQAYASKDYIKNITDIEKSVVEVIVRDEYNQKVLSGSGFYIGEGLFITNFHIIDAGTKFELIDYKNNSYNVEGVVIYDEQLDVAILKTVVPIKLDLLSFGTIDEMRKGEEIFTIGNPLGLKNSLTSGVISGIREINNKKIIQISAPITGGSSGGLLFNSEGKVIGINTSGYTNTNINFSLPIDYAIDWIQQLTRIDYKDIPVINWNDVWQLRKVKTLKEITPIIKELLTNLENEDLNEFIKLIHPESPSYSFIRLYLTPYFSSYDFKYQIESIELIQNINGEINTRVSYKVFKIDGDEFNNQQIIATYKFKKWKENWRLYTAEEKLLYELSPYEKPISNK